MANTNNTGSENFLDVLMGLAVFADESGADAAAAACEAERAADIARAAARTVAVAREKAACECPRCGGSGKLEGYYYIDGGRCFRCGGSGKR